MSCVRTHNLFRFHLPASKKVTLMTLPSRKNRRITALKLLRPINAINLSAFCILTIAVCNFILPTASAQYQEPPKFQQPTSFRYLLGVRNNNRQGYGSATQRGQQAAGRTAPPTRQCERDCDGVPADSSKRSRKNERSDVRKKCASKRSCGWTGLWLGARQVGVTGKSGTVDGTRARKATRKTIYI